MPWVGGGETRGGRGGAGLSGRADAGSGGGEGEGMGVEGGDPPNTQYVNRHKSWYQHTCGAELHVGAH